MKQPSAVVRIKGMIVAFFLFALVADGAHAQEIELWGYGPVIEDRKVQEALMHAVDWSSLTSGIFKDPYMPVVLYPQEGEPLDNVNLEFDPELAAKQLEEAGYKQDDLQFALLYVADFGVELIAGAIADDLGQLNILGPLSIEVTPFEASTEDELYEAEVYLADESTDLNALVLEFAQ